MGIVYFIYKREQFRKGLITINVCCRKIVKHTQRSSRTRFNLVDVNLQCALIHDSPAFQLNNVALAEKASQLFSIIPDARLHVAGFIRELQPDVWGAAFFHPLIFFPDQINPFNRTFFSHIFYENCFMFHYTGLSRLKLTKDILNFLFGFWFICSG